MRARSLLAMASMLATAACSSKPYVALTVKTSPPVGEFTPVLASLPVGVVVEFSTQIQGGDQNGAVSAAIDDGTRASVTATTTPGQFVLVGLAAGKTTLRLRVNGVEASYVPVEVSVQRPPIAAPDAKVPSPGPLVRGPDARCASATPSPGIQCMSASACAAGEVCCVGAIVGVSVTSVCTAGSCPPSPFSFGNQLCASSAECDDGGTCAAPAGVGADAGFMLCNPAGADGGP